MCVVCMQSFRSNISLRCAKMSLIRFGNPDPGTPEQYFEKLFPMMISRSKEACTEFTLSRHRIIRCGKQESFTCRFGVKTAQADRKRLKSRERVSVIHREDIFTDLPELQDHGFLLRRRDDSAVFGCCNQLEVLDGGNGDTASKVQAPAPQLLVPPRCLVLQNQALTPFPYPTGQLQSQVSIG